MELSTKMTSWLVALVTIFYLYKEVILFPFPSNSLNHKRKQTLTLKLLDLSLALFSTSVWYVSFDVQGYSPVLYFVSHCVILRILTSDIDHDWAFVHVSSFCARVWFLVMDGVFKFWFDFSVRLFQCYCSITISGFVFLRFYWFLFAELLIFLGFWIVFFMAMKYCFVFCVLIIKIYCLVF
jgi:hypothetical protein